MPDLNHSSIRQLWLSHAAVRQLNRDPSLCSGDKTLEDDKALETASENGK